jgi:hypothetical protein
MPSLEASHSIVKACVKSGRAYHSSGFVEHLEASRREAELSRVSFIQWGVLSPIPRDN